MTTVSDSQSSGRLVTQPVRPTTLSLPANSLYENQINRSGRSPRTHPRARRRLHHRRNSRWRRLGPSPNRHAGCRHPSRRSQPCRIPARDRLPAKPTAGAAGQSHSLLRRPPPRVATRCRCRHPPSGQVLRACATSQLRSSSAYVLGLPGTAFGAIPHRRSWNLPVPAQSVSVLLGVCDRAGCRDASRCRRPGCGLPPASSRLDTRPAHTPVNASPPLFRAAACDSSQHPAGLYRRTGGAK